MCSACPGDVGFFRLELLEGSGYVPAGIFKKRNRKKTKG